MLRVASSLSMNFSDQQMCMVLSRGMWVKSAWHWNSGHLAPPFQSESSVDLASVQKGCKPRSHLMLHPRTHPCAHFATGLAESSAAVVEAMGHWFARVAMPCPHCLAGSVTALGYCSKALKQSLGRGARRWHSLRVVAWPVGVQLQPVSAGPALAWELCGADTAAAQAGCHAHAVCHVGQHPDMKIAHLEHSATPQN